MKNWMFLTGDVSWEDYGAKWARKDARGVWWILDFENKAEWVDGAQGYYCSVKRLKLSELKPEDVAAALRSCGWTLSCDPPAVICEYSGGTVAEGDSLEPCLVDCIVGYGIYAPMGEAEGNRATWVRAEARRLAESLMSDPDLEESALSRPCNRLGATAAEFGRGENDAPLRRVADAILKGEEPEVSTEMSIMLRMYSAAGGRTLGGKVESELAAAGDKLKGE